MTSEGAPLVVQYICPEARRTPGLDWLEVGGPITRTSPATESDPSRPRRSAPRRTWRLHLLGMWSPRTAGRRIAPPAVRPPVSARGGASAARQSARRRLSTPTSAGAFGSARESAGTAAAAEG
eukprot:CAMPEP_0182836778 /NCGR_PEP_ID=MMETSP0006_2-20121128/22305_1 /TAXON_ID=97485 /ORGANISM="Prymnesium parvum, Strain Texoma1" /LENGTH=122 /DNA_ID=CAMNT_0024965465 /DNA_START=123 /DNA_END=489 /DNA_ORIENTATION=-